MKKLSLLKISLCVFAAFGGTMSAMADIVAKGTVLDNTGDYLIGATVMVKGKAGVGTATDIDGNFSLSVPEKSTLFISYIGYDTRELPAATDMGEIILQPNNNSLDEVVVIGYGAVKRKDLTTAVSTVGEDALANRPIVSAAQAIQGKAPGVAVQMPTGAPGSGMTVRVRGTSSFNGSNEPLYVVDGVPVDNINFLSPSDIENMQILKDASSAAIYGSRGANGVVIISTKQGKSSQAKVSVGIQAGWTNVAKKIDVLNTAQYYELLEDVANNGGVRVTLPAGLTDQTDWFDATYRTGNTQNYEVAVSQRAEKMSY